MPSAQAGIDFAFANLKVPLGQVQEAADSPRLRLVILQPDNSPIGFGATKLQTCK